MHCLVGTERVELSLTGSKPVILPLEDVPALHRCMEGCEGSGPSVTGARNIVHARTPNAMSTIVIPPMRMPVLSLSLSMVSLSIVDDLCSLVEVERVELPRSGSEPDILPLYDTSMTIGIRS